MNDNKNNLEQDLKNIDFDDTPDHAHRDLLEQKLLLNFTNPSSRQNVKWRTIMNNKITKAAFAAVLVVAVMAGLSIINGTGSVALAHVLDKIAEIRTYAYRMRTTVDSDYTEFDMLLSEDYGMKVSSSITDDATGQTTLHNTTYISPSDKTITSVIYPDKVFVEVELTSDLFQKQKKEGNDPRYIVENFLDGPYIELGKDTIDGVRVVGFESTDIVDTQSRTVARLWVDVATELPVLIEIENFDADDNLVSKMINFDFDWTLQVAQSDFEPVIPEGFTSVDFGETAFSGDEKSIVEGLRFFAELTGGKYPESLAVKTYTLSNQLTAIVMASHQTGNPIQMTQEQLGQGFMHVEFTVAIYGTMVSQNKAVAYHGDEVTPNTPDAVLMRWRQDDGRYMVIFGDLTTKQVTEDALAELEAMPIN